MKSIKQRFASKKFHRPSASSLQAYIKKRKQRLQEEEKQRRAKESSSMRLLTSGITFASMTLGLSFIPLFPQPLPVLIAFLIAFGSYQKPHLSVAIGGLIIGLGMMYNLASMNFIAMLGPPVVRAAIVAALMYFFVALPLRFRSCEDAMAIDIGIMAATLLFFGETYIFAVPLLLTVSVLFKRTQGALALTYYAMISVPLQIMQFAQIIPTIARSDWWQDPLGVPPLYVPLSGIFQGMQEGMNQFRLFDQSKVVSVISSQLTASPPASANVVGSALSQYLDSFPGIILFLALVLCLIFVVSIFAEEFSRKNYAMRAEVLFPAFGAAGITALFFLLATAMQQPLAFRAQLNTMQMALGIVMTILFAVPIAYANYLPKKRALIEERSKLVMAKAEELQAKLQDFKILLGKTKVIPVDTNLPEGNMLLIEDKLNDIIAKTTAKLYDPAELNERLAEMNSSMNVAIDNLTPELAKVVEEYQLQVNYEYTVWLKKLRALGFEAKTDVKADFQKDMLLEARVENIRQILETSRVLANEVSHTVDESYSIIRALFDQTLPEESRTIAFAKQQMEKKVAPWFATDALFTALINWKALYGKEISTFVEHLRNALAELVNLNAQAAALQPILGEHYVTIKNSLEQAQLTKRSIETRALSVPDLPLIREALEASLAASKDVLSTLYVLMERKETSIEALLPVKEDFWEKNVSLKEQTAFALQAIAEAPKQEYNKIVVVLPNMLSRISTCIDTLTIYSDKEELLLNYPVAKTAIEEQLKQKKRVSPKDLPFETRYAEEYLRLFYTSQGGKHREFSYDEDSSMLVKKHEKDTEG